MFQIHKKKEGKKEILFWLTPRGHVQNSINGSGSILPSSFLQVCPWKTLPAPEKISLTRVCQDLPRKFFSSAAVAAFANTVPRPAQPIEKKMDSKQVKLTTTSS